jgi:hypothetical protein
MNPEQPSSSPTPPPPSNGWTAPPQSTPVTPSSFETAPIPASASYLDQIATPEPVRVHKFAVIGLIGGVLVLLLVVLMIMMNSGGPSLGSQAKFINGRLNTLNTLASAQQKHLEDNTISSANATLSSVLTTIDTDLTTTMKAHSVTLSSTVSTTEKAYATTLTDKLDDAYQRGTLDRTYAPQITYELSILRSKLVTMKGASSSTSIRDFCTTAITSLDALIKTFKEFSSTS